MSAGFLDVDGDGDLDLHGARGEHLCVFTNDGGSFSGAPCSYESHSTKTRLIRDISGDGCPETVAANPAADTLTLAVSDCGGDANDLRWRLSELGAPRAFGDFDGNGTPDVIAASEQAVSVITLSASWEIIGTETIPASLWHVVREPIDFDGDGDLDVVGHDPEAVLLRNDGSAGFTITPLADLPDGEFRDFDGDADADAAARFIDGPDGEAVRLYLNADGLSFRGPIDTPVSPREDRWRFSDLDGDRDLDLITIDEDSGSGFSVYLYKAAGRFGAPVHYPAASAYTSVAFVDFDGDGRRDLLFKSGAALTSYLSDGAGGFAAGGTFLLEDAEPLAERREAPLVLDLNGDGIVDFAFFYTAPEPDDEVRREFLGVVLSAP
jgi:hypothetical protein